MRKGKKKKNPGATARTGDCYLAAVAQGKAPSSWNLWCFSAERKAGPALASPAADSHLPSARICIHFNAHIEREHVFNGNHSKMNYTDSVSHLMIYVRDTLKQMTGAGWHGRRGWQESREAVGSGLPARTPLLSPARGGQTPARELSVQPSLLERRGGAGRLPGRSRAGRGDPFSRSGPCLGLRTPWAATRTGTGSACARGRDFQSGSAAARTPHWVPSHWVLFGVSVPAVSSILLANRFPRPVR